VPEKPARRVSLADRMRAFLSPPRPTEGATRPQPDPGKPLPAAMPEGSSPREWVPRMGRNLAGAPRTEGDPNVTAFSLLWSLANQSPLVQNAIADVINQVSGMDWTVRLAQGFEGQEEKFKAEIALARAWLAIPYPPKRRSFRPWLRKACRELLVTDALALIPRRDRAGRPVGLQHVAGQTIKPLVEATGEPPDPPAPAFQQWVDGSPETNYTLDELWYVPMNPRPDSPYGMSPTEMVLLTVNCAMRGELFDLAFYTTGTMPDSIGSLPGFTQKQVQEWQRWWDDQLQGNDEARAGGTKFVPGPASGPIGWIPTRKADWSLDQHEWWVRTVYHAFGVSPLPMVKSTNRASGETLEVSSLEAGPRPVAAHLAEGVFTPYVQLAFGTDALEIAPAEDETEDQALTIDRHRMLVSVGGMTRNELREANGMPPEDDPNADRPFVVTGAGVQYLDEIDREPPDPQRPTTDDGEQQGSVAPGREDESAQAAEADLERWQRVALKCLREGRTIRAFDTHAIPDPLQRAIRFGLEKATTADEVRKVFRGPFALAVVRRAKRGSRPLPNQPAASLESSSDG